MNFQKINTGWLLKHSMCGLAICKTACEPWTLKTSKKHPLVLEWWTWSHSEKDANGSSGCLHRLHVCRMFVHLSIWSEDGKKNTYNKIPDTSLTPHHTTAPPEWSRPSLPIMGTRGRILKSAATCDRRRRTCGQYEGLGGSHREWGRGVVAVPAVWVKRSKGQMRGRVNNWPKGEMTSEGSYSFIWK